MEINTKQAFKIIKVIKKINIKEEIKNIATNSSKIQEEQSKVYAKLAELMKEKYDNYEEMSDEEKTIASNEILTKNTDLLEKISELKNQETEQGMDLVFSILEKIDVAEKEIYSCLAEIFNKTEKEIATQEIDITITQIKQIIESKSFSSFFKLATR